MIRPGEGPDAVVVPTSARVAVDRVVELAVPFAVEVLEGQVELGRYPTDGPCTFSVPGRDFEATMWSV